MPDYNYSDFDDQADAGSEADRGPTLPGGISVQAAATGLLIVVLLAMLWLFFGPTSSEPTDLPTATPSAGGGTATLSAANPAASTPTAFGGAVAPASVATAAGAPTSITGAAVATTAGAAAGATSVPGVGAVATPAGSGVPTAMPAIPTAAAPAAGSGSLVTDGFIRVVSTDGYGMSFRFGPGLDYARIRIADENETMRILGGPETGDGYTWYRLQDAKGNIGWAAQEYLSATAAPSGWNPPVASPTFETGG